MKGKYMVFNDLNGLKYKAIAIIALSLIVCGIVSVFAISSVTKANEKAAANGYIMHKGSKIPLQPIGDPRENLEILLEGHVENFHAYLFNIEPDMKLIKRNIEDHALHMVDDSGRRFYVRLVEDNFYKDVVVRGFRYEFEVIKINIDYSQYPFPYVLEGRHSIEKNNTIYKRSLVTSGRLKEAGITTKNLNGIKILDFKVIENKEIQ